LRNASSSSLCQRERESERERECERERERKKKGGEVEKAALLLIYCCFTAALLLLYCGVTASIPSEYPLPSHLFGLVQPMCLYFNGNFKTFFFPYTFILSLSLFSEFLVAFSKLCS
jgi:hypothetical protein